MSDVIAVIKIRSHIGSSPKARKTMELLGLKRKFNCAILDKDRAPMVQRCKDYVAFGEIDKKTLDQLKAKVGDVVNLKPPRGGLKSIKRPFKAGGSLGYRGKEINELIVRMI
jgi:large subunit ribosomal protein L30